MTAASVGTPLRERWAPVVVDRPVSSFDPRPANRSPYRPDTIVDAWSTSAFTVRLASIRGYAHRYYGTPRQDDAVIAVHDPTGSLIFAVADGVSAAERAEIGAQLACGAAADGMLAALDNPRGPDWTQLVASVARRLVEQVRPRHGSPGDDSERAEKLFATTLVAGFVRPTDMGLVATLVQVGDSGAWLLDRGCYVGVLRQKSNPDAPVFSSTVSALPQLPTQIYPVTVQLALGTVLLVGTDGFGDPLGDGSGLVGDLFREVLASPPPPLGLAHALDFSRETFDDDRTLLVVWPLS
ncbi:MAG: protein phosphatase 2C domain-containing protein [Pseudonocardiaceae bacterium]